MKKVRKVCVIHVGKHAEELTIYLLGDSWEVGLEVSSHYDSRMKNASDEYMHAGRTGCGSRSSRIGGAYVWWGSHGHCQLFAEPKT